MGGSARKAGDSEKHCLSPYTVLLVNDVRRLRPGREGTSVRGNLFYRREQWRLGSGVKILFRLWSPFLQVKFYWRHQSKK